MASSLPKKGKIACQLSGALVALRVLRAEVGTGRAVLRYAPFLACGRFSFAALRIVFPWTKPRARAMFVKGIITKVYRLRRGARCAILTIACMNRTHPVVLCQIPQNGANKTQE